MYAWRHLKTRNSENDEIAYVTIVVIIMIVGKVIGMKTRYRDGDDRFRDGMGMRTINMGTDGEGDINCPRATL